MEIEIKFRIDRVTFLKRKIASIKAKRISKKRESDFYFDTPSQTLLKNKILLRLRKAGKTVLLTVKGKKKKSAYFKIKNEIEVEVSDFEKAKACLEALGFRVTGGKEKVRELYVYKNTKICIDPLPLIGTFVEIEGTKRNIIVVAKLLGFDYRTGITKSYDELMKERSKEAERQRSKEIIHNRER